MSVSEAARRSGLHRTTISDWANGRVKNITIDSVYRLADAFGVDRTEALHAAGGVEAVTDPEVDLILAANRSDRWKQAMIQHLMQRREEERQRRLSDLRIMLGEDEQAG